MNFLIFLYFASPQIRTLQSANAYLTQHNHENDAHIGRLQQSVVERDSTISRLQAELKQQMSEHLERVNALKTAKTLKRLTRLSAQRHAPQTPAGSGGAKASLPPTQETPGSGGAPKKGPSDASAAQFDDEDRAEFGEFLTGASAPLGPNGGPILSTVVKQKKQKQKSEGGAEDAVLGSDVDDSDEDAVAEEAGGAGAGPGPTGVSAIDDTIEYLHRKLKAGRDILYAMKAKIQALKDENDALRKSK
jgi:hypothetical protein